MSALDFFPELCLYMHAWPMLCLAGQSMVASIESSLQNKPVAEEVCEGQ